VQRNVSAAHEVEQAAGSGHDDVHSAANRVDLRTFSNAAVDGRATNTHLLPEGADVLIDLCCELTGRRDDQRARVAGWSAFGQALEDGQDERGRLAGAGLRDPDEVAPGQNGRDRRRLNRCRRGVADVSDGLQKLRT
jgi:hypothetical protein